MYLPLSFALVVLSAPLARAGNVHIVGGPASTAPTIQAAVDAAVDGDIVLVRTSTFGSVVIDGKGLALVDESAGATSSNRFEIRNLPANSSIALRGFNVTADIDNLVWVHDCQGHVRLEDLVIEMSLSITWPSAALRIENCADVALHRVSATGADTLIQFVGSNLLDGGVGMFMTNASVTAHESTFMGGRGAAGQHAVPFSFPPRPGAAGVHVVGPAQLDLRGCTLNGGVGGAGLTGSCAQPALSLAGGTGGPGLLAAGSSPSLGVTSLDTVSLGGPGGLGGAGDANCGQPNGMNGQPGSAVSGVVPLVIPDTRRELVADTLTREQQTLDLVVEGAPGEVATLLMSSTCQLNLVPQFQGAVLVGPSFRRIPLGIVPGSGVLNASLPVADLAPGVQGSRRFLQAFCRDANGQVRLTGCASVVFLDAAY